MQLRVRHWEHARLRPQLLQDILVVCDSGIAQMLRHWEHARIRPQLLQGVLVVCDSVLIRTSQS